MTGTAFRLSPRISLTASILAIVLLICVATASAAGAAESYTFYGKGTAHGVGLDMAGVKALADQGKGYQEILKTYYSGVAITGGYGDNWLRVGLFNGGDILVTSDRPYLVFTDDAPSNSPTVRVAAGTITHVTYSGGNYVTRVDGGASWTKGRHTWFFAESDGRLKTINNGRRYRGLVEARHSSSSGLLWGVNVINIEDYVKGIAEEPNTWPTEGQRTLATAARTYALNKKLSGTKWDSENFDLDATMGSQYYLGLDAERSNLVAATDYTKGQVVTYNGAVIVAAYHGNSGGHTESMENVWGGSAADYPYLRGVPSPWTTPYRWGPKTFTKAQLQDIFNRQPAANVGTLYSLDFSDKTPSGRLRKVRITGSAGTKEVWGYSQFANWLGLPSGLIDAGAPKDRWDWKIMLANPGETPANAKLVFMFPSGRKKAVGSIVPANGRTTVNVDGLVPAGEVGLWVYADQKLVAERVNYFNYSNEINGSHGSVGSNARGKRWYVAEGLTGAGRDSWISVLNSGAVEARVTATFMPGRGRKVKKAFKVPARSRRAFLVDNIKGLKGAPVPAVVSASSPVVVERATYINRDGFQGGHSSRASKILSRAWYFAEGYTGPGFTNKLLIFNPGDRDTGVTVRLSKGNGGQLSRRVVVGARSRKSILLNSWVSGKEFGIRVFADAPVVAERTIYFNSGGRSGISSTVGSPVLSTSQFFAGGETALGFEDFLTVLNPQSAPANLKISYLQTGGGILKTTTHKVGPNTRATFFMGALSELGPGHSVAVRIGSDVPIVSEKVSYFSSGSGSSLRKGGDVTIGTVSPSKNWYFSEGMTE